jgi:formamidopyrimidine-DNA glycosylase
MPELPEVETVVRALRRTLVGRRISAVHVRHAPSVAGTPAPPDCVRGLRVQRVERLGKFIVIGLEAAQEIAVHLRMTGRMSVVPRGVRDPDREPYVRVWFALDGGALLLVFSDVRTFGRVWCGPAQTMQTMLRSRLGPDPLVLDTAVFVRALRARRGRLKTLLLNQKFVAGIGNIYADEALFAARLHPLTEARRVNAKDAARLHRAIKRVLNAAIAAGGTTIADFVRPDGQTGWFQRKLRVYGRDGEACRRCGAAIKRIVVGQRGTWFCPRCQRKR